MSFSYFRVGKMKFCRFWLFWKYIFGTPQIIHYCPPLQNIRPTTMSKKNAKTNLKVGITTNWTEFADEPSSQSYLCSVRCLLS